MRRGTAQGHGWYPVSAREWRLAAALVAALIVPWWAGAIWLAHTAWTWLVATFGGPGYAGLALGTIVSIAVVIWDEHHWATRRRTAAHTIGPWEPQRTNEIDIAQSREDAALRRWTRYVDERTFVDVAERDAYYRSLAESHLRTAPIHRGDCA